MADSPVRLGIVGLGAVAQLVYEPILARRRDLFEIVGVAELSAGVRHTVGGRLGVAPTGRHSSVGELLAAGGLDAVLVLSSGSHAALVDAVTAEGIPVLVEKPLAWTHAELDALADRAALVQVGYMKRFDPAYRRLAELLAGGGGPAIRAVEVTVLHPSDARQVAWRGGGLASAGDVPAERLAESAAEAEALCARALGPAAGTLGWVYSDVLLGSLIHDLAILRPLVGDPAEIGWSRLWPAGWHPERLSVGVDAGLAGGAELSLRWHYLPEYPSYTETVRVHTETGSYGLTFPAPYLLHAPTELTVRTASGDTTELTRSTSHVEAFEAQLENWHAAVTGGLPPAIGIDEARADVTTCQRIAAALAGGLGLPLGGEAAALGAGVSVS
ncbi:MAG TPA: Gfo/Idh/MocA family oxidoreductase [Pseudonocardia sp.]|jgi:predicted dehydrogenase|nr:Gfo/Idh/MocA family oxidoreductase [Pseudonocardia sp.]